MSNGNDALRATIYIVDDDDSAREGLAELLGSPTRITEAYASAQEFLTHYDARKNGCLILDMMMKGISGLALLKTLRERRVDIPIIVLTASVEPQTAVDAMKLGVFDYVTKPPRSYVSFGDLVEQAVQFDHANRAERLKHQDTLARLSTLTQREREVLDRMFEDESSVEIAETLKLSPKTIESHRSSVLQKMGVKSTVQLVRLLCQTRANDTTSNAARQASTSATLV